MKVREPLQEGLTLPDWSKHVYRDNAMMHSFLHPQLTPWYRRIWFWFFPPKLRYHVGIDIGEIEPRSPVESIKEKQAIVDRNLAEALNRARRTGIFYMPRMAGKETLLKEMLKPGKIVTQDFWPKDACWTCKRTLVELGRLLDFKGEMICPPCFKERVDSGDFTEINAIIVHETMTSEQAKKCYGIIASNMSKKKMAHRSQHPSCPKCGNRACFYGGPARGWICATSCKAKVSFRQRRKHDRCSDCDV